MTQRSENFRSDITLLSFSAHVAVIKTERSNNDRIDKNFVLVRKRDEKKRRRTKKKEIKLH